MVMHSLVMITGELDVLREQEDGNGAQARRTNRYHKLDTDIVPSEDLKCVNFWSRQCQVFIIQH